MMIVFENFGFFAGGWKEVRGDEVVIEASCLFGVVEVASLDDVEWITNQLRTQNSSKRKERRTGSKPPRINLSFLGSPFFKVVISFLADVSLL
jgi:hypothetical protein